MASVEGTMNGSKEQDEKNTDAVDGKGEVEEGGVGVDEGKEGEGVGNQEEEEADGEAGADKEIKEQEEGSAVEKEGVKEEKKESVVEEEGSEGKENEDKVEGATGEKSDEPKKTEEEKTPKISGKKRLRKGKKSEKEQLQSLKLPGNDRPTRERKTVERYMSPDTARGSTNKSVAIEKGRGTRLKDIPNVGFKLSKRKADENLQLLHTILFGKKAKVHSLKKNIGLFSGFVWVESEEKQRAKIKEKIDKCVKEKMLDFCDVLNISVNKATIKKEELSAKLLEFLESPHATTDSLLADREKSKKRKGKGSTSKSPTCTMTEGPSSKKQKLDSVSGKHSSDEEDDKIESSKSEDDHDDPKTVPGPESDREEDDTSEGTDEDQDEPEKQVIVEKSSSKKSSKAEKSSAAKTKSVSKESSSKASKSSGKSSEKPSSLVSKKSTAAPESKGKVKVPLTKKAKVDKEIKKDQSAGAKTTSKKILSKSSTEKDKGDAQSSKEPKKEPSRKELLAEVENILKEVDFNTATLSDILKQLGDHFGLDLMYRKREIKEIITEVIQNMSDDEDEQAAESGDSE